MTGLLLLHIIVAMVPQLTHAAVPALAPGVPIELARWRSQHYQDVRYTLELLFQTGANRIEGSIEISLSLDNPDDDLVLDWRGLRAQERALEIQVNTVPVTARFDAEHLIIPSSVLRLGANRVFMRFSTPISASSGAITRFVDRQDKAEYLYSLLVPSDASTVFPCFDQPDLKARFTLHVSAPSSWKVISNSPSVAVAPLGSQNRHSFAETEPISTYLFAFAAGPFEEIQEQTSALDPPPVRMFVRKSRAARLNTEAPALLALNRKAMEWFSGFFNHPYPFSKYDLILIPELAYGGMEHAGATFLREESVLFPSEPTTTDIMRRAHLLLHETSHQWFGNLVTMRWFDDLWLKEGFANLMATKASSALLPELPTWIGFHSLKTSAYRTDATAGTTPVKQPMTNLSAAKSAYGSIVYSKAPAILWQAEYFVGENAFRNGVRDFVKRHAYGAADWRDLLAALEGASEKNLSVWGRAWVEREGMPRIRARVLTNASGRAQEIVIEQSPVLGGKALWPQRLRVQIAAGGKIQSRDALLTGAKMTLQLKPARKIDFIYANGQDRGYGQFLLDEHSRNHLLAAPNAVPNDLLRAQIYESLWESVRSTELNPEIYLKLILERLPLENNDSIAESLLDRLRTVYLRYLDAPRRTIHAKSIEQFLSAQMRATVHSARRIAYFRAFADLARGADALRELKQMLSNQIMLAGFTPSSRDRFRMLQSLLIADDPDAYRLLDQLSASDTSEEGRRYAFGVAAANADAAIKREIFNRLIEDPQLPEAWIEEALGPLNVLEHGSQTAPLLRSALDELTKLKRGRKIFFVEHWLNAFVGGQFSRDALTVVDQYLASGEIDRDLRMKVLEARDLLDRTVRIREKYSMGSAPASLQNVRKQSARPEKVSPGPRGATSGRASRR